MDYSKIRDAARGCLVAGAMGDALGYAVEFLPLAEIRAKYGKDGIQQYALDWESGLAIVSDDTQMTMFTVNGLLNYAAAARINPRASVEKHLHRAYLEWYQTQYDAPGDGADYRCWLMELPALYRRRAPGNTCLSALGSHRMGTPDRPLNNSKGCGGVMRAAPAGLCFPEWTIERTDLLGAQAAAITHGHPMGYMPAAALAHIVRRLVWDGTTPAEAASDCMKALGRLYEDDADPLIRSMQQAVDRAANDAGDDANIRALGEGWVGDEALAVALYCCLRYPDDPDCALTAAVNHDGDSDSTGAIAGNIIGAYVGYDALPEHFKRNLEFRTELLELADDICAFSLRSGDSEALEALSEKYRRG